MIIFIEVFVIMLEIIMQKIAVKRVPKIIPIQMLLFLEKIINILMVLLVNAFKKQKQRKFVFVQQNQ